MKKLFCIVLALCVLLALYGCGGKTAPPSSETPPADPIVIKLTTTNSSSNIDVKAIQEHCENIKTRTDGMVEIQVYPDGQMLVYNEGIQAVMSNASVIYYTAANLFADYVPEFTTVGLPYLFSNTEIAGEFFESDLWGEISAKSDAAGLHVISNNFFNGYRSTFADKPIKTAADFVGLTIRIPDSTLYIETFKALKADYMPLAFAEVYSALQTGMIDAVEGLPQMVRNQSLWETMDPSYFTLTNHILDNAGYFIGYDFWMSIPEEYRTIIEEELYAAGAESNVKNAEATEELLRLAADNGVNVVEPDDLSSFKQAASDLVASYPMGEEVLAQIAEIEGKLN